MTQYAFYFDNSRCTGCKTCEMACKDFKDLSADIAFRKVYDYEGGQTTAADDGTVTTDCFLYHISESCNHCDNPACVGVCPTGAMHKDPETGVVSVNADVCIGCGYCHMACPYNSPTVDREKGHSVKCDLCIDRVKEGKNPICVDACPLRALDFGPVDEMAKKGEQADIAPLPSKDVTKPNLFIKACPAAAAAGTTTGVVSNPKEVL